MESSEFTMDGAGTVLEQVLTFLVAMAEWEHSRGQEPLL